jgi:LmbE family N-acetylglucosaminyl deacetylase
MRRIFWFRSGPRDAKEQAWFLSDEQHRELQALLSELGLHIVSEARGPVPLLKFGRRVLDRLGNASTVPLPHFADALKRVIRDMRHDQLRVMSPTDLLGVGYVYNAADPETWPVRTSR